MMKSKKKIKALSVFICGLKLTPDIIKKKKFSVRSCKGGNNLKFTLDILTQVK